MRRSLIACLLGCGISLIIFVIPAVGANDSAPATKPDQAVFVQYSAGDTEIGTLKNGERFRLAGPNNGLEKIPDEIAGWSYTLHSSGMANETVSIDIPAGATVYLMVGTSAQEAKSRSAIEDAKFTRLDDIAYTAAMGDSPVALYRNTFLAATHLELPTPRTVGLIHVVAKAIVLTNPPGAAAGSTTITKLQTEIHGLSVVTEGDKVIGGKAEEFMLTVTPTNPGVPAVSGRGGRGGAGEATVSFASQVGSESKGVLEDVVRSLRVKYPQITGISKMEFSFEDRDTPHDGPSIGAACATLILSLYQGFDVDPQVAMTGDVIADGKVKPIGGVSYKLRGAIDAGCTIVELPADNYDNLVDGELYAGTDSIVNLQIFGISTIDQAASIARTDRDAKLAQAIQMYADVQTALKNSKNVLTTLHQPTIQTQLRQILSLAPQHFSAKILDGIAHGTLRTRLTATATFYYLSNVLNTELPKIDAPAQPGAKGQPEQIYSPAVLQKVLVQIDKIRRVSDPTVLPLILAYHDTLQGRKDMEAGTLSVAAFNAKVDKLNETKAKVSMDNDLMQRLLKEGGI